MFPSLKAQNTGTFNNGPKGLTREILLGIFDENANYKKYHSIKTDDMSKVMDMCIFYIYDSLVSCCREAPRISPQHDGSVLVQVSSADQAGIPY